MSGHTRHQYGTEAEGRTVSTPSSSALPSTSSHAHCRICKPAAIIKRRPENNQPSNKRRCSDAVLCSEDSLSTVTVRAVQQVRFGLSHRIRPTVQQSGVARSSRARPVSRQRATHHVARIQTTFLQRGSQLQHGSQGRCAHCSGHSRARRSAARRASIAASISATFVWHSNANANVWSRCLSLPANTHTNTQATARRRGNAFTAAEPSRAEPSLLACVRRVVPGMRCAGMDAHRESYTTSAVLLRK